MKIAYQGEPGAFSEAAARRVDADAQLISCRSFEEVFASVGGGPATHGVLPIENSIGGSIHRNYDLLVEHELPIVGEVELKVEHCLLAYPGVRLEDVRVVHSHPQALAQCERFLSGLTGVNLEAVYDTAGGAKLIRDGELRTAAAIAHGYGESLVHRAADVVLKERRRLVLVPRETPLSEVHLENLLKLARMGVTIIPPMPAFYNKPATVDDIVDHIVARVLDQFDIDAAFAKRWDGKMGRAAPVRPLGNV